MTKTIFLLISLIAPICLNSSTDFLSSLSADASKIIFSSVKKESSAGFSPIGGNSDDYEITEYSDFKTSYFDNLRTNFGNNTKGSCGYVAIGMLLSYYDTFLCDDIIPEKYDVKSIGTGTDMIARRNSPGIMYEDCDAEKLSATGYYSYIKKLSDVSLHAKLITMGESKGHYNYKDDKNPCSTTIDQRIDVLNDYFSDVLGYSYGNQYSLSYIDGLTPSNSNLVREFTIKEIQLGNPVILAIDDSSNDEAGHALVAYDYDSEKDEIYCHFGINDAMTHYTIKQEHFDTYCNALAIHFNMDHTHSNNYSVTTISDDGTEITNDYCYHECEIKTYNESWPHTYSDHYEKYSTSKHKAYCVCGNYKYMSHIIDSGTIYKYRGTTYGTCVDCGDVVNMGSGSAITPALAPKITKIENGIYVLSSEMCSLYLNGGLEINDCQTEEA